LTGATNDTEMPQSQIPLNPPLQRGTVGLELE
jgi:hypothetical protein